MTENGSQAFVGMPESVVGKVEQLTEGPRTTRGSVAHVGVYKGLADMDLSCTPLVPSQRAVKCDFVLSRGDIIMSHN
jgi:hypothetical protein